MFTLVKIGMIFAPALHGGKLPVPPIEELHALGESLASVIGAGHFVVMRVIAGHAEKPLLVVCGPLERHHIKRLAFLQRRDLGAPHFQRFSPFS